MRSLLRASTTTRWTTSLLLSAVAKSVRADSARGAGAGRAITPGDKAGFHTARARDPQGPSGVSIQGVGNLLTRMAKCCNRCRAMPSLASSRVDKDHRPPPGCSNALRHHNESEERLIEVSWGADSGQTYPVDVDIIAHERSGLLRDITGLLSNEKINVLAVNTQTDKKQHIARMTFTLEIPDVAMLSRVLSLLDQIPNVMEVKRRTH